MVVPDAAVNDAKERVRADIHNSGLNFPNNGSNCTVELVPSASHLIFGAL